jgi:hypothetical protein
LLEVVGRRQAAIGVEATQHPSRQCHRVGPSGWQCRGPVARADDQQRDGIVLDDGTWVDVGQDGRWRPTVGERARAAVILGVSMAVLLLVALVLSFGDSDGDRNVRATATTSTSAAGTTPADENPGRDPSWVGDEPASADCVGDDREGQALRNRRTTVVLVRNGTSQEGWAGGVSTLLGGLGYDVTAPEDAGGREVTSIGYLAGYCAEAERVAEDLGFADATVEPVPAELLGQVGRAKLVLSLGADSL